MPADLLDQWLAAAIPGPAMAWLRERRATIAAGDARALGIALGQAGRRVGRGVMPVDRDAAARARPGWDPTAWSADQAARAVLALALPGGDPAAWLAALDRCFAAATVEESVALYQALPLLPHAPLLVPRACAGIRSSLTPVFAAVALGNPYPAEHLPEAAFNNMVLKCFFLGCDSRGILGLPGRGNHDLGRMLAHYARERRIAGRTVDPLLPPLARACGADCADEPARP